MKRVHLLIIIFFGIISVASVLLILKNNDITAYNRLVETTKQQQILNADAGNVHAQYKLALDAYNQKDLESSVKWATMAVQQNHAAAQSLLAYFLVKGKGIDSDIKKGMSLFKKSAAQGDTYAEFFLGHSYYKGKNSEVNYHQAFIWLRKAASKGDNEAQYYLGHLIMEIWGVIYPAQNWLAKAAAQGNERAQEELSRLLEQNNNKPINMAEDLKKSAEQGNTENQMRLGLIYEFGNSNIAKDTKKSIHWYKKAAESGHAKAQYYLGIMYYDGNYFKENLIHQDKRKARKWLTKAANQGEALAQKKLEYLNGILLANTKMSTGTRKNWKTLKFLGERMSIEIPPELECTLLKSSVFFECVKQGATKSYALPTLKGGHSLIVNTLTEPMRNQANKMIWLSKIIHDIGITDEKDSLFPMMPSGNGKVPMSEYEELNQTCKSGFPEKLKEFHINDTLLVLYGGKKALSACLILEDQLFQMLFLLPEDDPQWRKYIDYSLNSIQINKSP